MRDILVFVLFIISLSTLVVTYWGHTLKKTLGKILESIGKGIVFIGKLMGYLGK